MKVKFRHLNADEKELVTNCMLLVLDDFATDSRVSAAANAGLRGLISDFRSSDLITLVKTEGN